MVKSSFRVTENYYLYSSSQVDNIPGALWLNMNKIIILSMMFLASCSTEINSDDLNKKDSSSDTNGRPETTVTNLPLDLFSNYFVSVDDTIYFKIDSNWTNSSYQPNLCLPDSLIYLFPNADKEIIGDKTSIFPVGFTMLSNDRVILVGAQSHDLGSNLHVSVLDTVSKKIIDSYIVASEFGDAEVSQNSSSKFVFSTNSFQKLTTTCIAEIDWESDPIEVLGDSCYSVDTSWHLKNNHNNQ